MPLEERCKRFQSSSAELVAQQPGGGAVESLDLGQHQQIAGPGQRSTTTGTARRCPRAPAYSSPLSSSRTDIDMSVVLGGDSEVVEQPAQRRVGAVVVDQERGVDADHVAVTAVQVVGVGVTADPGVRFEQGDAVAARTARRPLSARRLRCR